MLLWLQGVSMIPIPTIPQIFIFVIPNRQEIIQEKYEVLKKSSSLLGHGIAFLS